MHSTLFLNPPSYEGFDGGAGSRYQARREIRSFWYPTWLAQPAACVKGSKLIDAPADGFSPEQVLQMAEGYALTIIHTSTPSFYNDLKFAEELKARYPQMIIGLVGAHVAVLPGESLQSSPAIDFVARKEFDYTVQEIAEGRPLEEVAGISFRKNASAEGAIVHNEERGIIEQMDELPSVLDVYERDLTIENYYIGYLKHPYLSLYTGRGCPARCTFCLWPQTIGGHTYRSRSPESVHEEMKRGKELFPQVKEFFFDDDTFTADLKRAEEIARRLKPLGLTWSCNARANVPYETLKILREGGLRLMVVGYESGNQKILNNIKKGIRLDRAKEFTRNCKKAGIAIHGTFILGLPGETRETIEETIRFACEMNPETIQVSLAAPYPGTELYEEGIKKGWITPQTLVSRDGIQSCTLEYPDTSREEVFQGVEKMYKKFYFRPLPLLRIMKTMILDSQEMKRRLREGYEFFKFMLMRKSCES